MEPFVAASSTTAAQSSSIKALSYELTLVELIDVAQSLRPANEADWVEAGGRLS
jgi:hypothetical protein